MGYKDITAGRRVAKLKAARFIKSSKGAPGIELAFEFTEPTTELPEILTWSGWFSEKAGPHTMKTLLTVCDYNGSEKVDAEGKLSDPSAMNYEKDYQLTIELEERKDDAGNVKYDNENNPIIDPRIKWVNNVGGSAFVGLSSEEIGSSLKSVGFRALFLAAVKEHGGPAPKKTEETQQNEPPAVVADEELPF